MKPIHAAMLGVPFAGLMLLATAGPASAASKGCDVQVNRTYADGTYEVTKQVMPNHDCVCYIQTGKNPQSAGIEQRIVALRRARSCDDAVVMAIPAGSHAVPGAAAGAAAFRILPALAATLGTAGLAIAAANHDNGPSSP
jgi:hypothetical protein